MEAPYFWSRLWANTWHKLVHVCRRWRYVVFSSPLRLDLRFYCTDRTSVRKMLDVWPPFPIEIRSYHFGDNIIAALEHRDRVCFLDFVPSLYSNFERLVTVMGNPFPALKQLRLVGKGVAPVLPVTFLGGSAPNLRSLSLNGVAFPTLPQLVLSCKDLSELCLHNIPYLGDISPESMAISLSSLTRLTRLIIEFKIEETGTIRDLPRSLPLTYAHLPALTTFHFRGLNEYLEDLLARINVPQIKILLIRFFPQPIFDIRQAVSRSRPLGPFDLAKVAFDHSTVLIQLDQSEGTVPSCMELEIEQRAPGQQLTSLVQICTQSSFLLSSVTDLSIIDKASFSVLVNEEDLMNNLEWVVLFDSFTAVRTLHLSGKIQWFIVSLLGGLTRESAIEVLPKLQNLFLNEMDWRDKLEEPLEKFIAARQHSDHPVTWDFDR
jgi:hypothetical protein